MTVTLCKGTLNRPTANPENKFIENPPSNLGNNLRHIRESCLHMLQAKKCCKRANSSLWVGKALVAPAYIDLPAEQTSRRSCRRSTAHEQAAYGWLPNQQGKNLLFRFTVSLRGVQLILRPVLTHHVSEFHRACSVLPSFGANSVSDRIQHEDKR
jgi:hypothetical protein